MSKKDKAIEAALAKLKEKALKANAGPHHVYTNPRDDNNWQANAAFQEAATPQLVLALLSSYEERKR